MGASISNILQFNLFRRERNRPISDEEESAVETLIELIVKAAEMAEEGDPLNGPTNEFNE